MPNRGSSTELQPSPNQSGYDGLGGRYTCRHATLDRASSEGLSCCSTSSSSSSSTQTRRISSLTAAFLSPLYFHFTFMILFLRPASGLGYWGGGKCVFWSSAPHQTCFLVAAASLRLTGGFPAPREGNGLGRPWNCHRIPELL